MLDVNIAAIAVAWFVSNLLLDSIKELGVIEPWTKKGRGLIPMRPMPSGNRIRQSGPNCNLYSFDGIHNHQAEFAVKNITF